MKNTSNRLLVSGLSVALGVGAAVSGVTLWSLMSQQVVHAGSCSGACSNPNGDQFCQQQSGQSNCTCNATVDNQFACGVSGSSS
jgi:hypothetical protein